MRRSSVLLVALLALAPALALAQHEGHDHAVDTTTAAIPPTPRDPHLPADEDHAREALERSPRHGEYVDVPVPGDVKLRSWVSYPER